MRVTVRMTTGAYEALHAHLFPGDEDEHAAFMLAGEAASAAGRRLLVREVLPVPAEEFVPAAPHAYRRVLGSAVGRAAMRAEELGLRLICVHSHPGPGYRVGFSEPDRRTHERAHPGLIRLTGGRPVGSLVFARDAVAGEVWEPNGEVIEVEHLDVVGTRFRRLTASPRSTGRAAQRFARQLLMFGEAGQQTLREMTVTVLGAGGGGSLLVQQLAHLGVGTVIVIDFDRVGESNLSRIVGSRPADARGRGRLKVDVMARVVHRIDPTIRFIAKTGNITFVDDARQVAISDFVFAATDTMEARFAFNALCHQYLVPGLQIGVQVLGGRAPGRAGAVDLALVAMRAIELDGPCLECQRAINAAQLHEEQLSETERRNQRYVDAPDEQQAQIEAPSVISLNSISAGLAMTEFQAWATGRLPPGSSSRSRFLFPAEGELRAREHTRRGGCRFCDPTAKQSLLARGDDAQLPLRRGAAPIPNFTIRDRLLRALRR